MGALFRTPSIPGPSEAQVQAQEAQARLAAAEEKRLAEAEAKRTAARDASRRRLGGRSLLMIDDVGVLESERAPGLQQKLGG